MNVSRPTRPGIANIRSPGPVMISETTVARTLRRFSSSLLLVAVAGGALLGCATTNYNYDYASEPDLRRREFLLGPSDVLRVVVWHNADLSVDATVRPDGTITLPLVGDVRAAGRTAGDV